MKSYLKEYFEYNAHFNLKLSDIFVENHGLTGGKSHRLFSHILDAHHIWNHRILLKLNEYDVWELQPVSDMQNINSQNHDDSMHILEHLDLNKAILYQNSSGQKFQNKISDILFHVINHSTYHRGQIATNFRENGMDPLKTDYIFWKRESL